MPTKLKITVTKEILEKSKNCQAYDGSNCAVSLAIRDIFPNTYVNTKTIDFDPHNPFNTKLLVSLPSNAYSFIRTFDEASPAQRINMKPISFEIEIPDEVIDKINIDELKPLLQNHPTLQLV